MTDKTPTDAEIVAVMRDGYNCRYNDEQDHIDFASAALAKWGQPTQAAEPVAWQPIETAPSGKIVLVHYKNRLGNGRTMRARYYLPETLESDTEESGWADEGWYEESEAYEYLMPLDGKPTHWMSLPPSPDGEAPQPAPAAQGDALDTERLDWLTFNISGKALRDIGVICSEHGDARRAIDAARSQAKEGGAA